MQLECEFCQKVFSASQWQNDFIKDMKQKGAKFLMLECPHCKKHFAYNPQAPNGKLEEPKEPVINWRTPIAACSNGYVCFVEEEDGGFYGCGVTGVVWREKEKFFQAIEAIIEEYPHRKKCYILKNGEWLPNPNEPKNMEELILTENDEDNLT